ncbi:TetR family transcriptional regulator [Streptomyces sp. NPDC058872]|uniref:TetR family transcriptional regulator n=1 Tax=Streptomyces sp. NPDC058872 TaxID=3346661 RepID=UPI0036C82DF4
MQDRAARTRQLVMRAAASEFDSRGYAGSSLSRITRAAGISVGALTFHFPNKKELAAAVCTQGHAATESTVRRVTVRQEPPLQSVASLSVALITLLEEEVTVRAAARLSREIPGCQPEWTSAWMPVVQDWLRARAGARTPAEGAALTSLATFLVAGAENEIRQRAAYLDAPAGRPAQRVAHIWELMLRGLTGETGHTAPTPPSTGTAPPVTNEA